MHGLSNYETIIIAIHGHVVLIKFWEDLDCIKYQSFIMITWENPQWTSQNCNITYFLDRHHSYYFCACFCVAAVQGWCLFLCKTYRYQWRLNRVCTGDTDRLGRCWHLVHTTSQSCCQRKLIHTACTTICREKWYRPPSDLQVIFTNVLHTTKNCIPTCIKQ